MGRKATIQEYKDKIINRVRGGSSFHDVCDFYGIHESTFYRWKQRGEKEKTGIYREFFNEINTAEKESKIKKIGINYILVDKLCAIQCTGEEIAGILNIDYDTLNASLKRDTGKGFSEYFAQKRGAGKISLRRKQWQGAVDDGNITMLIWLGKQYLGQADKQEHQLSGKDGGPIDIDALWQKAEEELNEQSDDNKDTG